MNLCAYDQIAIHSGLWGGDLQTVHNADHFGDIFGDHFGLALDF